MKYEVFWKNPGYKGHPELKEDIECDYLIVGGGVTGVSLAYFLNKLGAKNIVLIEKNQIASGATGKAAGTLVTRGEMDLDDLIKIYGKKKGELFWIETVKAMEKIEHTIKKEKIKCDLEVQDTLYCGFKHKTWNNLYKEYDLNKQIDKTLSFIRQPYLKNHINTDFFDHAIRNVNHGISVNPIQFTQNLSVVVAKLGVRIFEKTNLINIKNNIANTQHGDIKFKKIIWAIDAQHPSSKVHNIKSTIAITRKLNQKELEKIGFAKEKKIVWDSRENYSYFKITKDNRILVGFGGIAVHKKHNKTEPHLPHIRQLHIYLKKVFPYLNLSFEYAWSGSFGHTHSLMPLIERKNNSYSIAGAATQVVCFMSAEYLAHKLIGKKSNLEEFFDVK